MSESHERGLAIIWPGVESAIRSARVRERRRRVANRTTALAVLLLATVAGYHQIVRRPIAVQSPATCACRTWQIENVEPLIGVSTRYPLVESKRVFVVRGAEGERRIACLEKRSGRLIWEDSRRVSDCRLAADDQRLYALIRPPGDSWSCVAFDAATGSPCWAYPNGASQMLPPSTLTTNSEGICWTQGNRVFCRNKADGALAWTHAMDREDILSAPESRHDQVLVASQGNFYALDAKDGRAVWQQQLTRKPCASVFAGPILSIHEDHVFIATRQMTGNGTLWCLSAGARQVLWKRRVQSPRALLVSGNQLFLRSSVLKVLHAQTGATLWQAPIGGCGAVSARDGRVYLADARDRSQVLILDGATGRRLETRAVAGSCNGIVISGCMGFLSSKDGNLYAFPVDTRS